MIRARSAADAREFSIAQHRGLNEAMKRDSILVT
jgi:hypothetical protein